MEKQSKAAAQIVHLQEARDKRQQQVTNAREAVEKQILVVSDLSEHVRVAKEATKTLPESVNGACVETLVDSDLRS